MTKQLIFFVFSTTISLECLSQIVFEKGYLVDESGQKTECLIKNLDRAKNPTEFEYKLSEDGVVLKASIETVREFGVNNVSKWIRSTVNVDQSGYGSNNIGTERNPVFESKTLFLKVLVEGKASLFLYRDGNMTRFFLRKDDSEINQLVYKRYFVGHNIATNNYFHQQLADELACESMKTNRIAKVMYAKSDLEKYFTRYNECSGSGGIGYKQQGKRDLFSLSVNAGVNYSSLSIENDVSDWRDFDFDSEVGFRFGLGFEYTLPFNKNKWGIFLEPAYQYYRSRKIQKTSFVANGELAGQVDYTSVEVPIGVRHYFFLDDKSKIFADVSFIVDFSGRSMITFYKTNGSEFDSLDISGGKNLGLGLGYKFMDKFSVGLRYQTGRHVMRHYIYWDSSYNATSIMLGYSLF